MQLLCVAPAGGWRGPPVWLCVTVLPIVWQRMAVALFGEFDFESIFTLLLVMGAITLAPFVYRTCLRKFAAMLIASCSTICFGYAAATFLFGYAGFLNPMLMGFCPFASGVNYFILLLQGQFLGLDPLREALGEL